MCDYEKNKSTKISCIFGSFFRLVPKCLQCMDYLSSHYCRWKMATNSQGEMAAGKYSHPMEHLGYTATHLKKISQIENLHQIGVEIKNCWNHHLLLTSPNVSIDCKSPKLRTIPLKYSIVLHSSTTPTPNHAMPFSHLPSTFMAVSAAKSLGNIQKRPPTDP